MESVTIKDAAKPLIDFVKGTQEYKQYFFEKDKLSRLPQLKDRIDEYRMKRFELQHMEDETLLFEKTDEFLKEYETFRDNPVVSEFLASEAAFCQMMRELYTVITESIEFDMDFEQDRAEEINER